MAVKSIIQGVDNKKLILKTARKLVLEKGAKKTSLSDIAKSAGISKGTLYYYYATKRELIYDIAADHMNTITITLIRWIKSIGDTIEPEEILAYVYRTFVTADPRSKLHIYLLLEAVTEDEELLKRFKASYTRWNNMLLDGLRRILPKERKKDIPVLTTLIITSITGSFVQHLLGNKDLPYSEMARLLLQ